MAGAVPPQIESPKTFIGVGTRELVILGVCALLGTISLFIPSHLAIRIGIAVLVAGLGLAMAFGRDRRSGKTIEEKRHTQSGSCFRFLPGIEGIFSEKVPHGHNRLGNGREKPLKKGAEK